MNNGSSSDGDGKDASSRDSPSVERLASGKSTSFSAHASTVSSRTLNLSKSRVPLSATYDETVVAQAKRLLKEEKAAFKEETGGFGWYEWLGYFIPCFVWLKTYKVKEWLLWDVLAGLSVGAMVIPQGMSYANLAGLPQVYGLYGAFVPCLVYSLLGSSKQLSVGPVAVTSILLGNGGY